MAKAQVPNPYLALPDLPQLKVTSSNFTDGETIPVELRSGKMGIEGGEDRSPQVSWSSGPVGTKSYAVTFFDPDAPTVSGFWHWALCNIPASVTELESGANNNGLPHKAMTLNNDAGFQGYVGCAPPPGHGDHRYYLAVHALDVESVDIDSSAPPAQLGMQLFQHAIARGVMHGVFGY